MTNKNPRHPARVPSVVGGSFALAPVPPRSSVLPPGAGNEESKKALKADDEGVEKTEKRTVRQTSVVQGHLDTPTIRPNGDGDVASIATVEQTQGWSPNVTRPTRVVRAVYEAADDRATIRTTPNSGPAVDPTTATDRTVEREAPDTKRPSVTRRPFDPRHALRMRAAGSSPALPRLENQGGAGECGKSQKNSEGLSLHQTSHLINTSACQRRG
jgi:hypothetical protein